MTAFIVVAVLATSLLPWYQAVAATLPRPLATIPDNYHNITPIAATTPYEFRLSFVDGEATPVEPSILAGDIRRQIGDIFDDVGPYLRRVPFETYQSPVGHYDVSLRNLIPSAQLTYGDLFYILDWLATWLEAHPRRIIINLIIKVRQRAENNRLLVTGHALSKLRQGPQ